MAAIATTQPGAAATWAAVARSARQWLASQGLPLRDSVLLVPFAALLAPARDAFAAQGGWLPRIETPLTLAASLGPAPQATPGALSGDAVLDRLNAQMLLRQQPWGGARERQDRRGFAHIVASMVDAAQAFADAAALHAPAQRADFWATARAALPPTAAPAAFESLLLRVALEWAAQGGTYTTDSLFAHRPAAWLLVRLGGADALAEALPAATGAPGLVIDLDADNAASAPPQRWVCDSLEQEAQAAAAQVITALNEGRAPVALVALDRVLVRRVRALLERQAVQLLDETGWTLTTTRAAAWLMSLLRAAAADSAAEAATDARLEWLKGWPPAAAAPRALAALEAAWRGGRPLQGDALALWSDAAQALQAFNARREQTLAEWLLGLSALLGADGSFETLQADAAGEQVLRALRLGSMDPAWRQAADALRLDLAGFTAWVDNTLEAAQFLPPPGPEAEVVLTPLARAIGRPFAQVVVPAADQRHLGAIEPAASLIGEALAQTLGLDSAAQRRVRQRLAFAQLLRAPAVALLRRRLDGDEPLAASPEVEALALARALAGTPLPPERNWLPAQQDVALQPLPRPAPAAAQDLPQRLSASSVEALRQCPYRFFARAVLRVTESEEVDAELAKRDYGNWLHAVLHRFHRDRDAGNDGGSDDSAALAAAADAVTTEQQLDASELLPYRASFETFAPAYLAWLHERDAQGWRWEDGEAERSVSPPALQPQQLKGRLDRLDRGPDGSLQLIDYKTGSLASLKAKVATPLEDTQLAFYAALEPGTRSALYLALDDAKAPVEVVHDDVVATSSVLLQHLGAEMARLRDGAGLPALGEGAVCDTCEARGLCRRDHWSGV